MENTKYSLKLVDCSVFSYSQKTLQVAGKKIGKRTFNLYSFNRLVLKSLTNI